MVDNANNSFVVEAVENINNAITAEKDNNSEFEENFKLIYYNSLTDDDVQALSAEKRPTFTFNIIQTILNHQFKNVRDSSPSISVKSNTADPKDKLNARLLTERLKVLALENNQTDVIYQVSKNVFVGGKGIIKLKTDFKYKNSFKQQVKIENIYDPTMVFFDPNAIKKTKEDSQFCCEMSLITEKTRKRLYPSLKGKDENQGLRLLEAFNFQQVMTREPLIPVVDYYYKEIKNKKIYGLETGASEDAQSEEVYEGKPIKISQDDIDLFVEYHTQAQEGEIKYTVNRRYQKMDPTIQNILMVRGQQVPPLSIDKGRYTPDGHKIVREREQEEVVIKRARFVGQFLYEKDVVINFDYLPFVYIGGNNQKIKGQDKIVPYAKSAIDAQRVANIILNIFCSEAFNNKAGVWVGEKGSVDKTAINAMKKPWEKNIILYEGYHKTAKDKMGNPLPTRPPQYTPPAPLPSDYLQAFTLMYETAQKILGANYLSLDQTTSGEHLYKMTDYINAAIEPYMQNLLEALNLLGKISLSGLRKIEANKEKITMKENGEEKVHEIDYNFPDHHYDVHIERGVSRKLQQERTVETLVKLSETSETFSQILNTTGLPLLLDNMEFNNKEEFIVMTEKFLQAQQNKKPSPQEQAVTQTAQAKVMQQQNAQQRLQLDKEKQVEDSKKNDMDAFLGIQEIEGENMRNATTNFTQMHDAHLKSEDNIRKERAEVRADHELLHRTSMELMQHYRSEPHGKTNN